jgi:4'-phosphopantetheinyl transferase
MQKDHSTSDSNSWRPCPEGPELAEDEVYVWHADLDCEARVLRRLKATLSTDERARANRFLFQPLGKAALARLERDGF